MFHTYIRSKCNSFDAFSKKLYFPAAILDFFATEKNAQHLQSGIHRIWNQHSQINQNPSKTIIYVEKQNWVTYSLN